MEVVLLIWYSNKNFGFRKIESYLASKIDFEIWKCPILTSSASNCLTRYDQILTGCSLGCKNALNFTCLTMKFHNCGHTSADVQSCKTAEFRILERELKLVKIVRLSRKWLTSSLWENHLGAIGCFWWPLIPHQCTKKTLIASSSDLTVCSIEGTL